MEFHAPLFDVAVENLLELARPDGRVEPEVKPLLEDV